MLLLYSYIWKSSGGNFNKKSLLRKEWWLIKNPKLRKVFKIPTSFLKRNNWDANLTQAEAMKNGWIVTLAESTMIRWINEINGVSGDELYEEIRGLRRKIKVIKSEEPSKENGRTLRDLYNKLNELLLLPEYLLLVVENNKDYLRACEGFSFNGRHYKRLLSTTNGVKLSTIVFASDYGRDGQVMRDELFRRVENGRDPMKTFIPAKLEAYRALTCSSSLPVSDPQDVLVVPDVMTHFRGDYILLSDNPDGVGEPLYEEVVNGECENNATDGFGLISPRLMEIWSAELGEPETASGMCIRMSFLKGMVFPFPIDEFAAEVAHNYIVKDIWGNEHNILDVDLILPESVVKLWDSYGSWDEYWEKSKSNGYTFSVTKICDSKERETREMNYQFLNCMDLSDDDIDKLIEPTISDLEGVCGGDIAKAIIYLHGDGMTEASVSRLPDDWTKALMIDPRVVHDPYVRGKITQLIRRKMAKAKLGRIRVNGDYHVISFDPYLLCQGAFNLQTTGLLKAGEVFSWYWHKRNASQVVIMRAPMTIENNIRKMNVAYSDEMAKWFRYMKHVMIINSFDQTAAAANGADADGDQVMSTNNLVILQACNNPIVVQCSQSKGTKVVPTEEMVIQANMLSFGNDVGSITNRATAMYDVRSLYPPESDEYKELSKRLAFSQHYQQGVLDRAKGVVITPMPTYFYRERDAAQRSDLDRRICVSKKPWFMTFRYQDISSEYSAYHKKANIDCRIQFGCSVEDMLSKKDRTKEEEQFIGWYRENSPVSLGDCTSNRIARRVAQRLTEIKNQWRAKGEGFSYTIYRPTNKKYTVGAFGNVLTTLSKYESDVKSISRVAKANNMNDSEIAEYRSNLAEDAKIDCYLGCSGATELAALVLDTTYGKNRSSHIPWDLCGDIIIKTLLERNNHTITYYVRDPDGEIEYKGERYAERQCVVKEDDDDSLE